MLVSLLQNDIRGYEIFVRAEPGCPDCVTLVREALPHAHIEVNRSRLGVRVNPYQVLLDAFLAGSQFNVYLEDDLILAPDAFFLADWFRKNARPDMLCLNFLNYESRADHPAALVLRTAAFNALGLCMTRSAWEAHFQPQWFRDEPGNPSTGWDWSIHRHLLVDSALFTVQPLLSRSNHTGRYGTYCRPTFHDRTFSGLAVSSHVLPLEYSLQPGGPVP